MESGKSEDALEVLLADDDREDIIFFSDAINEAFEGITLRTVENGLLLMQLLQKYMPDILFLDAHMPCMDGKECIKSIRADKRFDALPVIIYSGMDMPDIISGFYRAGPIITLLSPQQWMS
ncbi:CheY-like chemotaxis protein [Filimonas zeae]|uniref:Response regulatory domain-containing protein n=1 Tax=Filimonas zeae TaxID=1737353 RepID=A0A917J200_9BACT|nr:response regulator [Filimonas zeae]MDR6340574.1 CheY-like chemotaxis protein [Filimonas zeae]GGH73368.1 hypothetical protein GCM10011379_34810 [Filimonas zeae]